MQPFQSRVVDEKTELDVKLEQLKEFTVGDTFSSLPIEEQERLQRQSSIMQDYSDVLQERIDNFTH